MLRMGNHCNGICKLFGAAARLRAHTFSVACLWAAGTIAFVTGARWFFAAAMTIVATSSDGTYARDGWRCISRANRTQILSLA